MAATLKSSKRRTYSTYLDVIHQSNSVVTELVDKTGDTVRNVVRYAGDIETEIYLSDDLIFSFLRKQYSSFDTVSWASLPTPDYNNTYKISPRLNSVWIDNSTTVDPYTAVWTIEITSTAVAYKLNSSLEGNQGTSLLTSADTVSTNGDVTILTAAWENTTSLSVGDKFYFSVVDVVPIINLISRKLTASAILGSIFNTESPNASDAALTLKEEAIDMLNRLQKPYLPDGLRLESYSSQDISSIWVDYDITQTGFDDSSYLQTDTSDY